MTRQAITDAASILGKMGGSAKSKAKATASRANGAKGGRPKKIKVVGAGYTGSGYYADLSNGDRVSVGTTCNPAAFDKLVSKISSVTTQTNRGVCVSLRKWIS